MQTTNRNSLPETYFLLWRTTGDVKYRERAWELALAIHRSCRTAVGGYTDLKNVNSVKPVEQKDYQRAMLFSGTFRYLYLIFGNDTVFSLDDWFYNARGHPLPICGRNKYYPKEICEPVTTTKTTTDISDQNKEEVKDFLMTDTTSSTFADN